MFVQQPLLSRPTSCLRRAPGQEGAATHAPALYGCSHDLAVYRLELLYVLGRRTTRLVPAGGLRASCLVMGPNNYVDYVLPQAAATAAASIPFADQP